jgi:GTP-binding protein
MKNLFKKTEFMLGVTRYKNLPEDVGSEALLAGRSNAGKSSALNALTENPKLARISKTPGRTTEINFFGVNESLKLVDLPGYGFAKSSYHKRKDWAPLLENILPKGNLLKL